MARLISRLLLMPIVRDSVISVPTKAEFRTGKELPMPYQEEPNVRNIRDTLYRDIQVSYCPSWEATRG